MEDIPIYYGIHYSNPVYIYHYLTRIFPILAQLIRGDWFDALDRLFINFDKSYFNASNTKTDLKKLIPEIYFQPELFRNIIHLNIENLQVVIKEDSIYQILKNLYNTNEIRVEDVLLPNLSNNNLEKFICFMREIFERPEIKINNWIGYTQRDEEFLNRKKIFTPFCYEGFIDLNKYNDDERICYIKFFDLGINNQIYQIKEKKNSKKNNIIQEKLKNQRNFNNYENIT